MFNYLPEQAIACFLLYLLTNIQTASSNQPAVATKDGVLFNLHQKILLTEIFVKTEILVPYPVYNKTVESKLTNLTRELTSMWTSKNYGCPLNYTNMTINIWLTMDRKTSYHGKRTRTAGYRILKNRNVTTPPLTRSNGHNFFSQTKGSSRSRCSSGNWNWSRRQTPVLYQIGIWRMRQKGKTKPRKHQTSHDLPPIPDRTCRTNNNFTERKMLCGLGRT